MIILESLPDGYIYSNILLKLYLRSLKNDGKLMLNSHIPFNSAMLAQVTRQHVGVIEKAMIIFKDLGLIEILDNGAIYLLHIQNFIGQSSTEADRVRKYRRKIDTDRENVQMLQQTYDKCTLEIENKVKVKENKIYCEADSKEATSNIKKAHGSYKNIMLTDSELEDIKKRGSEYMIEKMSAYLVSSGKTYKNHKATIDLWLQKEGKNSAASQGSNTGELNTKKFRRSEDKYL